jgi:hypothetical protein
MRGRLASISASPRQNPFDMSAEAEGPFPMVISTQFSFRPRFAVFARRFHAFKANRDGIATPMGGTESAQ